MKTPAVHRIHHGATLLAALCACAISGCYDAGALLERAQSNALESKLVEVDLGRYTTTLPRNRETKTLTELNLHVFGAVPHYRVSLVRSQLEQERHRLRHETLAAVRGTSAEDLAEPDLQPLRDRIETVVNDILHDVQIEEVGFYQITLRQR